ncbi:hypothetical protein C8Q79DRAFT_142877 [Trametes meyenii]|nr:hypothetical protein C8Q79DRAFT_142877 [Trametes meyenii]
MLSAVAARKARLTQAQTVASPTKPSQPKASPLAAEPRKSPQAKPSSSSQKPPSKRKSSGPAENPPKKKKIQPRKSASERQGRYFAQQDVFKAQDNLIIVNETDSEASVAASSSSSDDELHPPRITRSSGTKSGRKCAWSPSAILADSFDEEDGDPDEQVPLDNPHSTSDAKKVPDVPRALSTFQPVWNENVFHCSDTAQKYTCLLLRTSETVALLGVYSMTVLQGSVSLAGVTLVPSTTAHPVFAPRSSPIPIVECLPRSSSSSSLSTNIHLPTQITALSPQFEAIIMLQELHTGIEGLGRICRPFDGFFSPSRWHRNQLRFDLGLDNVYFLPLQTPDVFPLLVSPQWVAAVGTVVPTSEGELDRRPVYLVRGPKNSGKSTFARLLLNKLLSRHRRVAYLECDLGQSEFTPGGMVSLNIVEQPVFGPPFSHPTIPFAAHYIGSTSPRASPSHYLDSVYALVQQYEIDVQNATLDEDLGDDDKHEHERISSSIPLVVNTMGWTKGMGADLARKVEEIITPITVFTFANPAVEDEGTHAAGPEVPLYGAGSPFIRLLDSVPPAFVNPHYTAADHRNLSALSYFHAVFPPSPSPSPYPSPSATSWDTSLPLCAQSPYEVDWRVAFDKLILTGAGMEDVVPSEVHRALNGAVVALVSYEPTTTDPENLVEPDVPPLLPYEQGAPPPLPNTSRCLGLALIRAISLSTQPRLQLLTPVPCHLLHASRALIMGELQLPIWGMLDFRTLDGGCEIAGYERGKVPYLRWGKGEGAGGDRRRVRRNLMRKGQM